MVGAICIPVLSAGCVQTTPGLSWLQHSMVASDLQTHPYLYSKYTTEQTSRQMELRWATLTQIRTTTIQ